MPGYPAATAIKRGDRTFRNPSDRKLAVCATTPIGQGLVLPFKDDDLNWRISAIAAWYLDVRTVFTAAALHASPQACANTATRRIYRSSKCGH
jgi:hypothetical protein